MRPIVILIALCLIRKSVQMVEFYEDNTESKNQLMCVKIALKMYLDYYRDVWIFSSGLNSRVNSLAIVPLIITTKLDLLRDALFIDRGLVIIFLEGNVDQDLTSLQYLQGIVRMRVSADLNYIAVNERGIIDIYKYTSISDGICGIAQMLKCGHCSDKSAVQSAFRPPVNFHKCPMRVATWVLPPYSRSCDSNELNEPCGIEGTVLEIIVKKVNATPLMILTKSPDDVRRLVANRDADLGIGGLDIRAFEGVSYSHSYMIVQATFIASHSTWVLKSSFMKILRPLQVEVWMGIGVMIVLIFILRILAPFFRQIYALQLFGIFLGIPVPRQPHGITSRIYFMSLVLFGYLCSQSYLTNLTKMLTTPQQQMIKSLDDLEHFVLKITGPADSKERFKIDYPRIYGAYQVQEFSEYYDNLYKLLKKGRSKSVYYIEEVDSLIAAWKTVEAINDRFNWYPVALVAPNNSLILKAKNNIIMRIVESGILEAYGILLSKHTTYQLASEHELTSIKRSVVLGFGELKCVFILLISGLGLSFVIFLIEITTSFIQKKSELRKRCELHPELSRQEPVPGVDID